eukprot:4577995-Prymnesium_polylepis.1
MQEQRKMLCKIHPPKTCATQLPPPTRPSSVEPTAGRLPLREETGTHPRRRDARRQQPPTASAPPSCPNCRGRFPS